MCVYVAFKSGWFQPTGGFNPPLDVSHMLFPALGQNASWALIAQGSWPWGDLPWTHLVDLPPGKVGFQGFARARPVAIIFTPAAFDRMQCNATQCNAKQCNAMQ